MRVGMNHPAAPLPLDAEERSTLEMWARSATAPHRVVSQTKALLMAGDGVANSRIDPEPGQLATVSAPTGGAQPQDGFQGRVGALFASTGPAASTGQPATGLIRVPQSDHHFDPRRPSAENVQIGRKNGMTRSVGADWGPQILRKSQKS